MDIQQAVEIIALTNEQVDLSRKYFSSRLEASKAKISLDQLLASKYLKSFRADKPNVGYEMAMIMLMEVEPMAVDLYKTWQYETATYKGIEKILDSMSTKISYYQSVMKYQLDGERNG